MMFDYKSTIVWFHNSKRINVFKEEFINNTNLNQHFMVQVSIGKKPVVCNKIL